MPEIKGTDKLFSVLPRKRFGKFNQLGMIHLGFSDLGAEDIFLIRSPLGIFNLGSDVLGDLFQLSGIYRTDNVTGKTLHYREPYYITKNPCSVPQQANRAKMTAAVAAWQALSEPEKLEYNQRAMGHQMSGYNLFLKQYLNS